MPPDLLQDGPAIGECSCGVGFVDGQVHVHDDGQGVGGQGALRWHGLRWRYPHSRDKGIMSTTDDWLQDRRRMDNAEGLWRVEDNLYDLSSFLDRHPGGREWLELTKVCTSGNVVRVSLQLADSTTKLSIWFSSGKARVQLRSQQGSTPALRGNSSRVACYRLVATDS